MTAAKWVDPDPIRVASAHGLTVLLYRRRRPAAAAAAARTGEQQPDGDGQDWLSFLDAEERAARAATVASATPTERMALGLFDDVPPGSA